MTPSAKVFDQLFVNLPDNANKNTTFYTTQGTDMDAIEINSMPPTDYDKSHKTKEKYRSGRPTQISKKWQVADWGGFEPPTP
ncbi:hypothetical protein [Thalassobacter sp. 16PALIMAR09]|uniref:hypothetical protein n=1 Tax=Thalassobacter sp. 16PALIMAR09 TaxID=1225651 RepID=UPI00190F2067|nr:hypothetical protein [Thalassobacter sp. 16PALIMAR09]